MHEQLTRIKRQIELIGLAVHTDTGITIDGLAEMYGCEQLTIKRDLSALRAQGVDIHSTRRSGVQLTGQLERRRIQEFIIQYLAITMSDSAVDKATATMVQRLDTRALGLVVALQRCVETSTMVVIDYEKEAGDIETGRALCPLLLFESDGLWRLLAQHDGHIKQYHLHKILAARVTAKPFVRVSQKVIDDMFRHSFRSWIGTEAHEVRIELSPLWARRIKPRQLFDSQIVEQRDDGSIVFETIVNSLEEIASWVVSRGAGVRVLAPDALRERVCELARGALSNY
ncbi:MAG: WYL domain-containing transcriptional regulator [Ignavibacteriae bacterium]|nr:WYL domain-containing transcriptional regulator [Ignavibacteriota bacterium]